MMVDELRDLIDAAQALVDTDPATTQLRSALAAFRDELRLCAEERVSEGAAISLGAATEAMLRSVAPRLSASWAALQ